LGALLSQQAGWLAGRLASLPPTLTPLPLTHRLSAVVCDPVTLQVWGRQPCKVAGLVGSRSCAAVHLRMQHLQGDAAAEEGEDGEAAQLQRKGRGRKMVGVLLLAALRSDGAAAATYSCCCC
jgi:hypothetical protein